MKQITLFVLALLCLVLNSKTLLGQSPPTEYNIFDLIFYEDNSGELQIQRNVLLHETINLVAPQFNYTASNYNVKCPGDEYYETLPATHFQFKVTINGNSYYLDNEEESQIIISEGIYDLSYSYVAYRENECEENLINYKGERVQVKKGSGYIEPDQVWRINLAPEEFDIPVPNLYPDGTSLTHYNQPEAVEAIVTIKLGEGNTELTRPVLMVDGVDFTHEVIFEELLFLVSYIQLFP